MTVEIRNWLRRVPIYAGIAAMALAAAMLVGFFPAAPGQSFSRTNQVAGVPAIPGPRLVVNYAKLPLSFEANQGQTDRSVNFLSRGRGYSLFLTGDEAVLRLSKPETESATRNSRLGPRIKGLVRNQLLRATHHGPGITGSVLRMKLVDANRDAIVAGTDELPGKVNYFLGNDPKAWRSNIPTYAKVRYQNIYRGVDLVYYGNQGGQLEYDFVVAPGADPAAITLGVEAHGSPGRPPLRITRDGDLIVDLDGRDVHFHKPVIYQPLAGHLAGTRDDGLRKPVKGSYMLTASHQVRFALGPYDRNQPLVIDPVLSYSTYLGGSGLQNCGDSSGCGDQALGIAVDSNGNAYVTGFTQSSDFPTTTGAYQTSLATGGTQNAFVTKLSVDGSSLVYSTYLGGSADDWGWSIAVDSNFNAYVAGSTTSTNFPVLHSLTGQGSIASPGSPDAFVAKLSADGSSLVYSTYLGGNLFPGTGTSQEALGIAVDSSGNAYVTGYTQSSNFPVQSALTGHGTLASGGIQNAFVAELKWTSPNLILVYSTYLGGNQIDTGYGIAVDSSGNTYVTGGTTSTTFPVHNAYQSTYAGGGSQDLGDAYVAKLNWTSPNLSLVYSTYLGGTNDDEGFSIAIDSSKNAYVAGVTYSTNFPTAHAYQKSNTAASGAPTAYVAKLSWSGSMLNLVYSTYLGGTNYQAAYGIATDSSGNAYVVGVTGSKDFPTQNPLYTSLNGSVDAFVAQLDWNSTGSILTLGYSTYLGGSGNDFGYAIAVDSSSSPNAYVTGSTWSTDFPTFNAKQTTNNATPTNSANSTAFVTKISSAAAPTASVPASFPSFGNQTVNIKSTPQSVTLNNTGSGPLTIADIAITTGASEFALDPSSTCTFPGGTVSAGGNCTIAVTFDPTATGLQPGTVTITDNNGGLPSTQAVSLSGTGTASASGVTLSTPSAFAGQFVKTTSSAQTVTLTNGGSSLAISAIVVTGPFNLVASGTTCSTSTPVAANGTCTIAITFSPTTAGAATGTLQITDNAAGSPQSANLSGTGWDFTLAVASSSSSTQTVAPGGPASYTLNLTGLGGFNQAVTFTCTGAPSEATCAASSASASSTGTSVTVSVTTTAPSMGAPLSRRLPPPGPLSHGPGNLIVLAVFLAALAWAVWTWWLPGTARTRPAFVALALGMLLTLSIAACGGGGTGPPPNLGTPAGTYPLTVTGTAGSGTNTAAHPVSLTLVVS
jgi:hypothetical protein